MARLIGMLGWVTSLTPIVASVDEFSSKARSQDASGIFDISSFEQVDGLVG